MRRGLLTAGVRTANNKSSSRVWACKIPLDFMVYEPKTDAGKEATANGADIAVVEQMEIDGVYKNPEIVEKKPEVIPPKEPKGNDGEDDKGKGGDDEKEEETPPDRRPQNMPIWKHKEELKATEKRIREELGTEITDLNQKLIDLSVQTGGATDTDIQKLAEDFNLEPSAASDMLDRMASIIEKRAGLPDLRKKIEADEATRVTQAELQGFENEWSGKDAQDILTSSANGQQITAQVKEKVKELAYTTTYAKYRLSDIIRLNADTLFPPVSTKEHTAESGRGGTGRGTAKPVDEMGKEDLDNLSDEEFIKISNELGKKGSRYQFTGKK